jgi:hypothetical protein
MEEPKRHFKYITIPIEIFDNEELTPLEKFIFALVDVLDTPEEGCYASNAYIAQKCMCTERSVSSAISHLCKLGYIKVAAFNGRNRILKSLVKPVRVEDFSEQGRKIFYADTQNFPPSYSNAYSIINKEEYKKEYSPQSPQGGCESLSQAEIIFEAFRKIYKGSKRGLKTELENFKKKHKDWREVLPNLKTLYEQQLAIKEDARNRGCFVPQEKNLSTYLNQRCWEEELNFENNERKYISEAERARQCYQELSNEICDFIANADLQ